MTGAALAARKQVEKEDPMRFVFNVISLSRDLDPAIPLPKLRQNLIARVLPLYRDEFALCLVLLRGSPDDFAFALHGGNDLTAYQKP